ncbi:putative nuclease HARBI1 isoform X1 [Cinnamomum micranthum f. kanehirae]|uniref:Putative nuclease HARBI1 isoform X1 n=1 Tax=Cinnamomum micranthum f. kanehirae TaxID=337451 RepID=A0A443NCS9_9MAGN|nr:putative nuclease HARBI1 isoform X1 [Cinnamomum micranthum f. kanehirae]
MNDEVIRLQGELYKKPKTISENSVDEKWKWFKGCLGALDGTYIPVHVSAMDRPRWEGSATNAWVLRDAIAIRHGLVVPRGTYYLVNARYTNGERFLTPYRGQRYHLNGWNNGRQPMNPKEFLNMKHSIARHIYL